MNMSRIRIACTEATVLHTHPAYRPLWKHCFLDLDFLNKAVNASTNFDTVSLTGLNIVLHHKTSTQQLLTSISCSQVIRQTGWWRYRQRGSPVNIGLHQQRRLGSGSDGQGVTHYAFQRLQAHLGTQSRVVFMQVPVNQCGKFASIFHSL
jgi:hypothetical protein